MKIQIDDIKVLLYTIKNYLTIAEIKDLMSLLQGFYLEALNKELGGKENENK